MTYLRSKQFFDDLIFAEALQPPLLVLGLVRNGNAQQLLKHIWTIISQIVIPSLGHSAHLEIDT